MCDVKVKPCSYKHNSFIYYLLLSVLLNTFFNTLTQKANEDEKIGISIACSKEKEGLIKECSITTDSLPKLAKIKQDEKLLGVAVQKSAS